MDLSKRDALLRRIGPVNDMEKDLPLVSLEEFFDGNDDDGSIWCNLPSAPSPEGVFLILKAIRDRPDVHDVRIMVTQFDGGDEWPFSDTIFFVTSADAETVMNWLGDNYQPDEAWIDDNFGRGEPLPIPPGLRVVGAWWD